LDQDDQAPRLVVRVFQLDEGAAGAFAQVQDGARAQAMETVSGMFVPTYQGLSAADFVRPRSADPAPFPFNAPNRLPFFRARNAIYHLFRELVARRPGLKVLAPDYNSGNEILALRAAGAEIVYCHVDGRMHLDPDEVEELCRRHGPDVLYVIHYLGWPQPMPELVDLCRRREVLLVEDCALALLSEPGTRPLGSYGHWAVFCLYKTLPLPNGALLVQNAEKLEALDRLRLRCVGPASVLGRTTELLVQRVRGRINGVGTALQSVKRGMGRVASALDVRRAAIGDIGFEPGAVDFAMSPVSQWLLDRLDFARIRRQRVENFRRLAVALDDHVVRVFDNLGDGICPLFFPIMVRDKHSAAEALRSRGVDALEFWNTSSESGSEMSANARLLRNQVLELPIHQDLTPRHVEYTARQVSQVNRKAA
jgi:dTDP-4-amino-4,6-dideoxygalactose transaminase